MSSIRRPNIDEYDCMGSPLLARLGRGADCNEIREYLDAEIRGHFGTSPEAAGTALMDERLLARRETETASTDRYEPTAA